jgi:hypothetical protein
MLVLEMVRLMLYYHINIPQHHKKNNVLEVK